MSYRIRFLFFLTLAGIAFSKSILANYPSAMDCSGRDSFNWYCHEPVVAEEDIKPVDTPLKQSDTVKVKPEKSYEEDALERFENLTKRLEDLRKIAIIDPTNENVSNYIAFQLEIQKKAAVFTDTWQRVQWQDPALDYSVRFPMNNIGAQEVRQQRAEARLENLSELTEQGWGLWFFYSSTCSFCLRMAPSINEIAKRGLQVLPVAIDGAPLPGLELPFYPDNGQAAELGVTTSPSTYLVNKYTRDIIPISFGIISYASLVDRIYVVVKTKPGDNF